MSILKLIIAIFITVLIILTAVMGADKLIEKAIKNIFSGFEEEVDHEHQLDFDEVREAMDNHNEGINSINVKGHADTTPFKMYIQLDVEMPNSAWIKAHKRWKGVDYYESFHIMDTDVNSTEDVVRMVHSVAATLKYRLGYKNVYKDRNGNFVMDIPKDQKNFM